MTASPQTPRFFPGSAQIDLIVVGLDGGWGAAPAFGEGPLHLRLTAELAGAVEAAGELELSDIEDTPFALVSPAHVMRKGGEAWVAGPIQPLPSRPRMTAPQLRASISVLAEASNGATTFVTRRPPSVAGLADLRTASARGPVHLVVLTGHEPCRDMSRSALIHATEAAIADMGVLFHVIDLPLDEALTAEVLSRVAPGGWRWLVEGPPAPAAAQALSVRNRQGLDRGAVVLFTGLSGSGKSTLAQGFSDLVEESGRRLVTRLDGDVVRRTLSYGLGFSRADREANVERIGWVAAEIARHGGLVLASPIAPFDETRRLVRALVERAGADFVLVHVATPLETCERRDPKGLYHAARMGTVPDFTGVSSPYEVPVDADVVIDTTTPTRADAVAAVAHGVRQAGVVW